MLQEVIHQTTEQLLLDDMSSSINTQLLEFCDSDFFQETIQNSDVSSSSNCYYEDNYPYIENLSLPPKYNDNNDHDTNYIAATTTTNTNNNNGRTTSNATASTTSTAMAGNTTNSSNLSSILLDQQDDLDNDISASIDFSSSTSVPFSVPPLSHHNNIYFTAIHPQLHHHLTLFDSDLGAETSDHHALSHYSSTTTADQYHLHLDQNNPNIPQQFVLPPLFEEDCLSSVHSHVHLNPASSLCSLLGTNFTSFMPSGAMSATDNSIVFRGINSMGNHQLLQTQELDYQADNNAGIYYKTDSLQHVSSLANLQAFSNETKQLLGGEPSSMPLMTELVSLEDSNYKVGKLSVEQRKEKINRYMKKRKERNFSKKIKYACRKTLADSRPRVRGRFAKNDDFGETNNNIATCSKHEEEEDADVAAKEEEEMVESTDIFSQINGVNSFRCNYSIQSWI